MPLRGELRVVKQQQLRFGKRPWERFDTVFVLLDIAILRGDTASS
ncbi:MAG TPA: hypothetical protein VFI31_23925 [Pirellulales bacterium]|nr:hypothetical protein [Pirellulales bacterium]